MVKNDYTQLISFLKDCLTERPEVSDWVTINDNQTDMLLNYLNNIVTPIRILDYGCGNLRLLNALLQRFKKLDWHYTGYDRNPPSLNHLSTELRSDKNYDVKTRKELLHATFKYDLIVVQNVIHEMGICDVATLLQDCHILLQENGQLLVIDLPLLPKGEPDFVPVFEWELKNLFKHAIVHSRRSPKGLPLLFLSIPKDSIPYYSAALRDYPKLLQIKRSIFVQLASDLCNMKDNKILELKYLGLDKVFDYVYLNVIVGNITRRLEHGESFIPVEAEVNELAILIINELENQSCSICEIYSMFGIDYPYEVIFFVLEMMFNHWMLIVENDTFNGSQELLPSELFDILLDHVGGKEAISRLGLERALIKARIDFGNQYPDSGFGL